MPIYEYKCPVHGLFEGRKPVDERAIGFCPQCGVACQQLMSICNWTFGWCLDEKCHERFAPRDSYVKDI